MERFLPLPLGTEFLKAYILIMLRNAVVFGREYEKYINKSKLYI